MTPGVLFIVFAVSMTAGVVVVGVFDWRRHKRFEPSSSSDHVFKCDQCGTLYTDDPDVECSRCPQCGTMNERIMF